jgi:dolichol-phosphate mannosyltransferase
MKPIIEVIIPAYNEEHRLGRMLKSYAALFSQYETATILLTVVPNGCTDNTLGVATELQRVYSDLIRIYNIEAAVGKGGAVYGGWKQSSADIVGFVDADGATSAEEFKRLIDAMLQREDIEGVIASRFIGGATVVNRTSHLRSLMSIFFVQFVRVLFWLPFQDTQCGAKLFRRKAIMEIMNSLRTTNMQFDVELLWKLTRAKKRVIEIPTIWEDQPGSAQLGSKLNFVKTGFQMIASLIRIRFSG